ncbi:MAG: hypothetical protein ACRENS_10685, partial [Candidatus Eiseniibacteriota bacterium]
DALRVRAVEIARVLGDDVPARSTEWWVGLDRGYTHYALEHPNAPAIEIARPSALRFYYRQSPRGILPATFSLPTRQDPAPLWSGEAYVALDPQGQLLEFSRLDRQLAPPDSAAPRATNWSALLALTGHDLSSVHSEEPLWTPDVACDERRAWIASDGSVSVRLEAASWRGKVVWFRTVAPWERAERDSPPVPFGGTAFAFFFASVALIVPFIAALAVHNLRLGRGDLRGALRVGVAVFICFALADSLRFRWSGDPLRLWRWMMFQPFFPALTGWLFYLGIEPFLRRRWPHRLIAWARLLEGRITDPLVGRDVLLGFLLGAGVVVASRMPAALQPRHELAPLLQTLPLGRAADFWSLVADELGEALMQGFGSFAVFLLGRVLFRRDAPAWAGLALFWVLISFPSASASVIQWVSVAIATACVLLAVRVGLLATIVAVAIPALLTNCTPLTLDFSRWYAWRTGVIAALLFAIAAWGFRAAMGRRRIISAAMLEG